MADLCPGVVLSDSTQLAMERLSKTPATSQQLRSAPLGPEWHQCRKLPVVVHVREQQPGEKHVSTREGIAPLQPDDLIIRGVQGEEYPIGRELFYQTYELINE